MRKTIVYFMMGLLLLSAVFAASVSRELPRRADPNSELAVKLQISGADSSGVIALEEELPEGISVKEWTVTGAVEAKADITTRDKDGRFAWEFTPSGTSATVEYKIDLGASDVTFGALIFFDAAGQGKVDGQTLLVAPITCGDGICEGDENSDNCEADCPKAAPPAPPAAEEPPEEKAGVSTGLIIGIIAAIIIIIIIFAVKKKKKPEETPKKKQEPETPTK